MPDDVGSLMSSAGVDPRIKKQANGKYYVEGVGEFESYDEAVKALNQKTGDKISGEGPTMTTGESSVDYGDEQSALDDSSAMVSKQPSAKAPGATSTGQLKPDEPEKPSWVIDAEKKYGIEYEFDPASKSWRPKKGKGLLDKATAPTQADKSQAQGGS